MTAVELAKARADIESTGDLLARAMKLAGLVTTLFREHGIHLVVVGGSAVEFYTEGGYMSGDIDFCRRSLKGPSLRLAKDVLSSIGGRCIGRNWLVCGLHVDLLGIVESETDKDFRRLETPYGVVSILPPELALVERVFYSIDSEECVASARQMMAAALADETFDWVEAERIAALPEYKVLDELRNMRKEVSR
ncbi:MAG: hypothetical protein K6G91_07095 [Kiritimatiellae bacterium]|nr:hypothetical protein [Kiritimatiellia bacterium]